jgi:hypothetical protein
VCDPHNTQNVVSLYQFVIRLPALNNRLKEYGGSFKGTVKADFVDRFDQTVRSFVRWVASPTPPLHFPLRWFAQIKNLANFESMVEQTVSRSYTRSLCCRLLRSSEARGSVWVWVWVWCRWIWRPSTVTNT